MRKSPNLGVRQAVRAIREATVCERCGQTPIHWHNREHEQEPHRRIGNMVGHGFTLEQITAEIAVCEALCSGCHIKEHGNPGGYDRTNFMVAPRPCVECGRPAHSINGGARGLCHACYQRARRRAH